MDYFDVLYSDGKSNRKQGAKLWLRGDFWEIQTDGDEVSAPANIRWPIDQIHKNETISKTHIFRFGQFPGQSIECFSGDFPKALRDFYPNQRFFKSGYAWHFAQGWVGFIGLLVVLLGIAAAIYFWALPSLTEKLAEKMPQETEINLGKRLAESTMEGLTVDSARTLALQNFAHEIDFQTNYPLDFTVVKSEELNAFAMPGGKIVVFERLLDKIETPAALAGLLAHEAAHVKKRHTLKAMARSLSGYLFVSLIFGDVNGLTSVILENANNINSLSFSRALEHEADEAALETLAFNGLDQKGMISLFKALQSGADGQKSNGFQFLSSHPLTDERINFCEKKAESQPAPRPDAELEKAFSALRK